jgi:hypothetical protein
MLTVTLLLISGLTMVRVLTAFSTRSIPLGLVTVCKNTEPAAPKIDQNAPGGFMGPAMKWEEEVRHISALLVSIGNVDVVLRYRCGESRGKDGLGSV